MQHQPSLVLGARTADWPSTLSFLQYREKINDQIWAAVQPEEQTQEPNQTNLTSSHQLTCKQKDDFSREALRPYFSFFSADSPPFKYQDRERIAKITTESAGPRRIGWAAFIIDLTAAAIESPERSI